MYLVEDDDLATWVYFEPLGDGLEDDVSCRKPCVGVVV
jgi:hypothetical protein